MMIAKRYLKCFLIVPVSLFILYVINAASKIDSVGRINPNWEITNISTYTTRSLHLKKGNCILRNNTDIKSRDSVDFRIIVITYNRHNSLLRLLNSLNRAHYGRDKIVLDVWIDRSKLNLVHNDTVHTALQYQFNKGTCNVYIHPNHVGITGQWLSTWLPASNSSEKAVILEDDLTVSPHFYTYLKLVHKKYGDRQEINGFALQGKSVRHSDGACCLNVPLENKLFLYPTLGTSGFSPNNKNWLHFHIWLAYAILDKLDVVPLIENNIAVSWYKSLKRRGKADSMWEMEYLFYTQIHQEFTLYPNFPGKRGLTFNWYEDGLHSTGERIESHEAEYNGLVMNWTLSIDQLPDVLIHIDNSGKIIE